MSRQFGWPFPVDYSHPGPCLVVRCVVSGHRTLETPSSGLCVTCTGGTEALDGICTDCPAGSYSKSGATSCLLCPPGTYTASPGEGTCSKCKGISYSQAGSTDCRRTCFCLAPQFGLTILFLVLAMVLFGAWKAGFPDGLLLR